MFKLTIDLGQIMISLLLGIVGYFVKRELEKISLRLDGHDGRILDLFEKVGELMGTVNARVKSR